MNEMTFDEAIEALQHAVYGEEVRYAIARALDLSMNTQQSVAGKEDASNKVTSMDSNSTDVQYPSAKSVYDALSGKENSSNKKTTLTGSELSNDFYPTTKAVADALSTKLTVKPIPGGGYDDCTESNTLYYGYVGGYYAYVLPVVVTGSSNQSQHKLRTDNGLVEHRARHYSNGAWGAWDSWTPAGVDSEIMHQIIEAYIAEHGIDLTGVERTANKVTAIGSGSTDTQYPSAKAVYNAIQTAIGGVENGSY